MFFWDGMLINDIPALLINHQEWALRLLVTETFLRSFLTDRIHCNCQQMLLLFSTSINLRTIRPVFDTCIQMVQEYNTSWTWKETTGPRPGVQWLVIRGCRKTFTHTQQVFMWQETNPLITCFVPWIVDRLLFKLVKTYIQNVGNCHFNIGSANVSHWQNTFYGGYNCLQKSQRNTLQEKRVSYHRKKQSILIFHWYHHQSILCHSKTF